MKNQHDESVTTSFRKHHSFAVTLFLLIYLMMVVTIDFHHNHGSVALYDGHRVIATFKVVDNEPSQVICPVLKYSLSHDLPFDTPFQPYFFIQQTPVLEVKVLESIFSITANGRSPPYSF
ncbi:hypothetical protein K8I28_08205 [bacterium]|nr:hypothetical protein [bacterium]